MRRSLDLLRTRLAELDDRIELLAGRPARGRVVLLLERFVDVLSAQTNTFMDREAGANAEIDPDEADRLVATSALLSELVTDEPSVVTGPIALNRQHWMAINWWGEKPPGEPVAPSRKQFKALAGLAPSDAGVKPFDVGMHTSTATAGELSSWRLFLEPYRGASELYSLPWRTWQLAIEDGVRVAEIDSARAWVGLVEAFPRTRDGFLVPDWREVAREFDAVHVSLRAVAAVQGFHVRASGGLIPPAFWDVESTFWLRWCFTGSRLVENVER
jgi:hypothetical protein